MDETKILFERESDAPDDWQDNVILVRDGKGNIVEMEIPDDSEEVGDSVGND